MGEKNLNLILFRVYFNIATEIRCQEKSKGGLRYEVILAEPNLAQVQIPKAVKESKQQTATPKPLSTQEIVEKLKAAEERRLVGFTWSWFKFFLLTFFFAFLKMYEAKKVADWTNKMAKIEETSRKKDELNIEFMNQTKETLINKMEQSEEKREAIISDMVDKLKVHAF